MPESEFRICLFCSHLSMSESTALPGKKALYCEVYKAHFHDPDECDHYDPTPNEKRKVA